MKILCELLRDMLQNDWGYKATCTVTGRENLLIDVLVLIGLISLSYFNYKAGAVDG
jgi:hypothetical protein